MKSACSKTKQLLITENLRFVKRFVSQNLNKAGI